MNNKLRISLATLLPSLMVWAAPAVAQIQWQDTEPQGNGLKTAVNRHNYALGQPYNVSNPPESINDISETFTNPLGKGADPFIVKVDGKYYGVFNSHGGFSVTESRFLSKIERRAQVWMPQTDSTRIYNFWAPEIHEIDGKWYIYFAAATRKMNNFSGQRARVLEADNPFGPYVDKGEIYTGFNPDGKSDNLWGIDMTVLEVNGKNYAVWSAWDKTYNHHDVDQQLMIAEMKNPWTIGTPVLLSKAELKWEKGDHIVLLEGPQVLYHKNDVFITYSTRGSWSEHYKVGALRLKSKNADPLDPVSWTKYPQPLFKGTPTVFGVGHASITTSPDDKEYWIYYHSKKSTEGGWSNREVYLQKFTFDKDGNPVFGEPTGRGKAVRPSGEVKIEKADLRKRK